MRYKQLHLQLAGDDNSAVRALHSTGKLFQFHRSQRVAYSLHLLWSLWLGRGKAGHGPTRLLELPCSDNHIADWPPFMWLKCIFVWFLLLLRQTSAAAQLVLVPKLTDAMQVIRLAAAPILWEKCRCTKRHGVAVDAVWCQQKLLVQKTFHFWFLRWRLFNQHSCDQQLDHVPNILPNHFTFDVMPTRGAAV
jgi:hypothetical protein